MDLLPLVISVSDLKPTVGNRVLDTDIEWKKARQIVVDRDNHTCRYCGFRSTKAQEIQFLDGNDRNRSTDNMVISCIFCWQVNNIGSAAARGWVRLCWAYELDHVQINHMVRAKAVLGHWLGKKGKNFANPEIEALRLVISSIDGAIDIRSQLLADAIGDNSPITLAKALNQTKNEHPEDYAEREDRLLGIRVIPVIGKRETQDGKDMMPEIIESWLSESGPYAGAMPETWNKLLRHYSERFDS